MVLCAHCFGWCFLISLYARRIFVRKRDGCPMASLIATLTPCVSAHFDSLPHNHLLNTHCEGFHLKLGQPREEGLSLGDRGGGIAWRRLVGSNVCGIVPIKLIAWDTPLWAATFLSQGVLTCIRVENRAHQSKQVSVCAFTCLSLAVKMMSPAVSGSCCCDFPHGDGQ